MSKETHDCMIGFLSGESVYKSTLFFEVQRIANLMPIYEQYGILNGKPLTPKEIVDNRRGNLSRFNFCPHCGEKLKWKEILKDL
jgi:hypothetical protein